jgi:hypothetical protein
VVLTAKEETSKFKESNCEIINCANLLVTTKFESYQGSLSNYDSRVKASIGSFGPSVLPGSSELDTIAFRK